MRLAWDDGAEVDTEVRSLCFCFPSLLAEDENIGRAALRLILSLVALPLLALESLLPLLALESLLSLEGIEVFVRSGVRRLLLLTGAAIEVGRRKALSRFVVTFWCFGSGCKRAGSDISPTAWDTPTTACWSLMPACSADFFVLASTVGCTAWASTEGS